MNRKILLVGAQSYLMLYVSNLCYVDLYKYHRTSTVIMEHKHKLDWKQPKWGFYWFS